MSTVKISELSDLTIPANTHQALLVAVDLSGTAPLTRKVSLYEMRKVVNDTSYYAANTANAAMELAIATSELANTTSETANVVLSTANVVLSAANVSLTTANTSLSTANDIFATSNSVSANVVIADQRAVTSGDYANAAFIQANTANTNAVSAGSYANAAYTQANTATAIAANSLITITVEPVTPLGNTGDTAGMVFLSNTAFFYCTTNYDGNTNIWSKIVSTDSW